MIACFSIQCLLCRSRRWRCSRHFQESGVTHVGQSVVPHHYHYAGCGKIPNQWPMATTTNISSTIDRIIDASTGASIKYSLEKKKGFLPSSSWKGPREGYYFGTSDQGTGYYIDHHNNNSSNGNHSTASRKRSRSIDESSSSHTKKSVRFGQDQVQLIPPKEAKLTGEQLLEQAEQSLADSEFQRKTLTQSSSNNSSNLKAYKTSFSKTIAKNQSQRLQHADAPEQFMESELNLQQDIQALQDLATSVDQYHELVSVGIVDLLVGLLVHDNTDIALVVVSTLMELLDPDLVTSSTSEDVNVLGWNLGRITRALLDRDVGGTGNCGLELIVANLGRLHEDLENADEEEKKGVDDILTLIENMLEMDRMGVVKLACREQDSSGDEEEQGYKYMSVTSILCKSTTVVSYLLEKLSRKDLEGWDTALRLHAAEVLATIIQHDDARLYLDNMSQLQTYNSILVEDEDDDRRNRKKKAKPNCTDGIECFLQAISLYRKKDPETDEECEYLENLFDALSASLLSERNVDAFLEGQGVELMLRCISERVNSGFGSLKVLFFCMAGSGLSSSSLKFYKAASQTFVEAGGLKLLFPIFMGRKSAMPKPAKCTDAGNIKLLKKYATCMEEGKKPSKRAKRVAHANRDWFSKIEMHCIQILYSLTQHLDEESSQDSKARLLAKFIESDCEKCDRSVELCLKYDAKMRQAEYAYFKSDEAENAEDKGINVDLAALNAKLIGGGDLFHRISAILAFAASGSKRCHEHILEQLRMNNSGIGLIKDALREFASMLDEESQKKQLNNYLTAI